MRKKNRILTESEKKQILKNKENLIVDNFRNVFNRIKRIKNQMKCNCEVCNCNSSCNCDCCNC